MLVYPLNKIMVSVSMWFVELSCCNFWPLRLINGPNNLSAALVVNGNVSLFSIYKILVFLNARLLSVFYFQSYFNYNLLHSFTFTFRRLRRCSCTINWLAFNSFIIAVSFIVMFAQSNYPVLRLCLSFICGYNCI